MVNFWHLPSFRFPPHSLLFQLEPSLLDNFPFCTDEQSRAHYKEFQGTHSEIPPNGWGILCREVFHVKESQFVCLQFKVAMETCRLRVLNNDSGEELPTVLHWVAPAEYQPNTVRKCSVLNEGITFSVHVHNGRRMDGHKPHFITSCIAYECKFLYVL